MIRRHSATLSGLPEAGQRLVLRIGAGGEHQARLDSIVDGQLMVTPVPALIRTGEELSLSWGSARGWCTVEGSFVGATADRVSLWVVKPRAEVVVTQRRQEARVDMVSPIEVLALGIRPVRAILIDLSAGGARCLTAPGTVLGLGDAVSVQVDTGELRCLLGGVVARRAVSTSGRVELAVRFRQPVKNADRIRSEVLRLQRIERARELD